MYSCIHFSAKNYQIFAGHLFSLIQKNNKNNKRKAVNVTANRVFFCVNSIHNLFVNPELINTTDPKKWGTLHAMFLPKND